MTRFWQRRLAVLLLVASCVVAGLYGASFIVPDSVPLPQVGLYSAIASGIGILVGLFTFLKTAPEDLDENARLAYLLLVGLIVTVIYATGTLSSPFTLLWGVIALAAPLFGGWGVLPVALIAVGVPFFSFFTGNITFTQAWQASAVAILPVLFGFFLKPVSHPDSAETKEDRSYRALARQLSQVSGKSDVVINAIGEGVLALDGNGTIELINPAAQQIVGWGKEDAVGLNYKSILKLMNGQGQEIDSAHDPVAQVFATNQSVTDNTLTLLTQSEKKLLVSVIVSPVGQPGSGAIVVFRDITGDKLEERQQAEFISTASHEMRTPVASIEGYLGLALNPQTATVDEKARDFITKAHEAAQHLGRLFQDLLDVSKADDNRMQNNPKVVDMVHFMANVTEGLLPKAQGKGLELIFKPNVGTGDLHEKGVGRTITPAFYVNVDNDHLREVMDNLVENAIKYTLKGQVTVDVTGDDQNVRVSIADTGIGIPREDLDHLFQKFYRVDNSETREIGGTGLGLYLCRKLVETMNGRIWAESVYQQGSTFFVELPRTSSVEASQMIRIAENTLETDTTVTSPAPTPAPQAPPEPSLLPSDDLLQAVAASSISPQSLPTQIPEAAVSTLPTPPNTPPPAPTPAPQAPPQTVYNQPPQPIAAPPPTQPAQVPRPIQHFPNTPLAAIEQNPRAYLEQVEGRNITVPQRPQP